MIVHPIPEPGRTVRREAFVNASRHFWSKYGSRMIDLHILTLVPTTILAPTVIGFFR